MSAESYKRIGDKTRIGRILEGVFRNADAQITAAQMLAVDCVTDDEIPIPEPVLQRTGHSPLGSGRNANAKISYQGFDVPEETLPLFIQTAVQLFMALGTCVTVGTALGTPFADTIASGQGTTSVVMTTNTSMDVNEHAGRMMENATSGISYGIISNTTDTLVLHKASSAAADGDTIAITEAPFTHTISEANVLPTQGFHYEMENPVDAQSIRSDILGVLSNTLEQIFEKGADGIQNVGLLNAIKVDGSDLGKPTDRTERLLNWSHAATFTLAYNSANPITGNECNSVSILINNNALIRYGMGNANAVKKVVGLREYEITLHIFPENKVLRGLVSTEIQDYLTDLAFTFKVQITAAHSIQYTFNKLEVIEYDKSIPAKDVQEKGLDMKMDLAPEGTLAAIGIDSLNIRHYEG